jgi:hypothetical protein
LSPRELLIAAARGGPTERRPVIVWPGPGEGSDAVVVPASADTVLGARGGGERILLAETLNPYGLAFRRGIDLNALLRKDPAEGGALLGRLCAEVREAMLEALGAGADGVLYRLHGAHPLHCTPMQYGGHFLERDRELLEAVCDAPFNLVFVVGDEGVYLDFVSDLPAQALGWDALATGISASAVRAMRTGALAAADPEAEIELVVGPGSVAARLEASRNAHV